MRTARCTSGALLYTRFNIPLMQRQNTDIGWNWLMLWCYQYWCYVVAVMVYLSTLVHDGVTLVLHYMSVLCTQLSSRQRQYRCLTDRLIFFLSGFWPGPPVATPQSHRPGFFIFFKKVVFDQDVSGHTTVCQTRFFKRYFRLGCQWPYHGLTDQVRGMATDILGQKSDKKNLKNTVCETVVWPLMLKKPGPWDPEVWSLPGWVKNLNTGIHRPSKLPLIDGWWMLALELVPSGSLQIRWHGLEEGSEFRFFFLLLMSDVRRRQEKKLNSPPSIPHHRICGNPEGNNSPASVIY